MEGKVVLFICVENAGRSLMAEAIFNADPSPGWTATSAGTRPASAAHPRTRRLLEGLGIGLPKHPPQLLSPELMNRARVRITMGCLDDASCPAQLKSLEVRDWALPNPANLDDRGAQEVRDRLVSMIRDLRAELALSDRSVRAPQRAP